MVRLRSSILEVNLQWRERLRSFHSDFLKVKRVLKLVGRSIQKSRWRYLVNKISTRNRLVELFKNLYFRLDAFLLFTNLSVSRQQAQQWIKHGKVLVNGIITRKVVSVCYRDRITLSTRLQHEYKFRLQCNLLQTPRFREVAYWRRKKSTKLGRIFGGRSLNSFEQKLHCLHFYRQRMFKSQQLGSYFWFLDRISKRLRQNLRTFGSMNPHQDKLWGSTSGHLRRIYLQLLAIRYQVGPGAPKRYRFRREQKKRNFFWQKQRYAVFLHYHFRMLAVQVVKNPKTVLLSNPQGLSLADIQQLTFIL